MKPSGGAGTSIALSCAAAFGPLLRMEPTEAEKSKAQRVQLVLIILIAVLVAAPLVTFFIVSRK
jgi:hypothetical protein